MYEESAAGLSLLENVTYVFDNIIILWKIVIVKSNMSLFFGTNA